MNKKNKGIALILVIGVLAILTLIATGFSAFCRLELKAAQNHLYLYKAELIAQRAIAKAIEELKYGSVNGTQGAKIDPYDHLGESWYYKGNASADGVSVGFDDNTLFPSLDNLNGALGDGISGEYNGGTYKLKIFDCAALVNINTALPDTDAENDFKNMLTEIGFSASQAQALLDYRVTLPNNEFTSTEQIKLASGIGQGTYDNVKNFITVYGDEDDGIFELDKSGKSAVLGHTRKSFININTSCEEILQALFYPMIGNTVQCNNLIANLKTYRNNNPFDGIDANLADSVTNFLSARGEFTRFIENEQSQGTISTSDRDNIIEQTDPNRNNTNSTHICFDSGGYYEIEVIADYKGAKKKIKTAVCIYRKIYQTTKQEFDIGILTRVSTKDTVPVNIDVSYSGYDYDQGSAKEIANSIKLGFWDDFKDSAYSNSIWVKEAGNYFITTTGDQKLVTTGSSEPNLWPIITLGGADWRINNFYAIAHMEDEQNGEKGQTKIPDATIPDGWRGVLLPDPPAPPPLPDPVEYTQDAWGRWVGSVFQRSMNTGQLLFLSVGGGTEASLYISTLQPESGWIINPETNKYVYFKPEMATLSNKLIASHMGNTDSIDCNYQQDKTFHLVVKDTDSDADVFAGGSSWHISHSWGSGSLSGGWIKLYGSKNRPDVDDVRVIPEQGVYTSSTFNPTENAGLDEIEWGTISAGVSLLSSADSAKERVFLCSNFQEDTSVIPLCDGLPPAGSISPSGANISSSTSPYITYRAYLFSGYQDSASAYNELYDEIPVVEDVTITYLPKTQIISQSKL
ncbi:MAG: hypothetical protein HY810_10810 [Candidatus Omnitrophica bacterium]|nr:hypothetical protein [Candidatus Omnitrophota bacterium]